jgi:hypothetical protein
MIETIEEKTLYYNKNNKIVRDTRTSDLDYLALNLRQSDKDEIMASHSLKPMEALQLGFQYSDTCLTACIRNEPFAIFGCCPVDEIKATIWMLGTPRIEDAAFEFVKYSKHFVEVLHVKQELLYNYVDARNLQSIKWLRMIGANIHESKPYGVKGLPFHYFDFLREKGR